ncbi:hypothetical protein [Bacillus sp. 1NLA3E]|uniref:hypothetical protein n=1 Tax=Bacillus sp. 1NLA3E TaxID=666686 RepID=UPI000247EE6E|nr:hypothetical protein [Bacillus sp. 1NLA3E]AGK53565.1 hypothetical protein B1NLA3E_09015 [Bacillus sp. 1NLA3E]
MFVVYFLENKNLLLSQFLRNVPALNEELKIKGRKGKVSSVNHIDEKIVHVQVILEEVKKHNLIVDNSKKKKRK